MLTYSVIIKYWNKKCFEKCLMSMNPTNNNVLKTYRVWFYWRCLSSQTIDILSAFFQNVFFTKTYIAVYLFLYFLGVKLSGFNDAQCIRDVKFSRSYLIKGKEVGENLKRFIECLKLLYFRDGFIFGARIYNNSEI